MYQGRFNGRGNSSRASGRGFGGGRPGGFGGNRGGGRGFSRGGFRTVKTFDPTNVINDLAYIASNGGTKAPVQEHKVTHTFNDFQISDAIKRNIIEKGFKTPTPIQDQAIEPILAGRDLIGIANTGTGKTAAFLIPLIDKVFNNRNEKVLIVAPTRELAAQIRDEFYILTRGLGIYSALCIGGSNMNRQKSDLRRNPNFVIGTPGRLEDHIRTRSLNLSDFGSVVLDEADHMVDIGFIQNIKFIISLLLKNRQSLFFSATIDGKVRDILREFVSDPVTVSVKSGDTAENVKQEIVRVNGGVKIEELHKLLIKEEFDKVLIFGRTKHGVQKLAEDLTTRGFKADAIHGNKRQNQRLKTLDNFKRNNIQILIATDVASRGLDIPNVSHVINYDLPESYEAYIHRIGRTGRADKKGIALTFIG
jgi:ATP-dependent RNA helicase RhlE